MQQTHAYFPSLSLSLSSLSLSLYTSIQPGGKPSLAACTSSKYMFNTVGSHCMWLNSCITANGISASAYFFFQRCSMHGSLGVVAPKQPGRDSRLGPAGASASGPLSQTSTSNTPAGYAHLGSNYQKVSYQKRRGVASICSEVTATLSTAASTRCRGERAYPWKGSASHTTNGNGNGDLHPV